MCHSDRRAPRLSSTVRALCATYFGLFGQTTLWAQSPAVTSPTEPLRLLEGQAVNASQRSDQTMTYGFDADPGQIYLVEVTQDGLDFIVTLEGPDRSVRSFNSPLQRDESEFILLEPAAGGSYRITLHSEQATNAAGSHTIRVSSLAVSDSELSAWRDVSDGAALNAEGSVDAKEETLKRYLACAETWEELGRKAEGAYCLYGAAMIEYDLYHLAPAAELAQKASYQYLELDNRDLYASTVFVQAYCLVDLATELEFDEAQTTFDKALILYDEAFRIHERLGNIYELAHITNYIGVAHFNRGDLQQAKRYWNQAASMFSSQGEWHEEFNVRHNLAVIDAEEGYIARAIDALQYIIDGLPDERTGFEAMVLSTLAGAHRTFGNVDEALQAYSSALNVQEDTEENAQRKTSDRWGEANSLRGIGNTYYSYGELELAKVYLEQALPLAAEVQDGRGRAGILEFLGNIAYLHADYAGARAHHDASLLGTTSLPDRAYRLVLASKDLSAMGRHKEAIARADEARELAEDIGVLATWADSLQQLGNASVLAGNAEQGIQHLQEALQLYSSLGLQAGMADTLHGLALASRALEDLDRAIGYGAESLRQVENLRSRLASPELRAFYSASRRAYYETQIDLLMTRYEQSNSSNERDVLAALATNERSRARMLVDLLAEASIDLEQGVDEALLIEQAQLYEELAARRHQRDRILEEAHSGPDIDARIQNLLSETTAIENELNLLEAELRRSSPRHASLTAPDNLDAGGIQALLDRQSVLLQYALGGERSFVWVVTIDDVQVVELEDRATIESAARLAFQGLHSYSADASARRRLEEDLATLSDYVITPVVHLLGDRRILIAADGALQYIPFAVLPVQTVGSRAPLLRSHEVVGLPSASVLATQRARRVDAGAQKTLVVFADPVLEDTDPRLRQAEPTMAAADAPPTAWTRRSSVGLHLGRLPATAAEAQSIAALVPETERLILSGFEASRNTALETDLSQFKYVHFATHGLVDSRYPALSALALSQFDPTGSPQSGFLRLHDIYNLGLNADLVVLSACETALGREIRGEGLIGLTQGFTSAGAKSIVASLWQVSDRATAELMARFYDYIFTEGFRPAQALRQAQLDLARERRWNDPFFWAGFTLLGEWQ